MHWIFSLDPAPLVTFVAAGLIATGFACFGAVSRMGHARARALMPVAPFFAAVATLFALFVTFLANDIWTTNARAWQAAGAEGASIRELVRVASIASDADAGISALAADYLREAREREWVERQNESPARSVEQKLDALAHAVLQNLGARPAVVSAELLRLLGAVVNARDQRLAIGARQEDEYQWLIVVFLAVLTQLAVGLVHLDRPKAAALTIAVFTAAAVTAIGTLALYENPYVGVMAVDAPRLADS